ncbi:iron-sulfur cluster repair di-iron protein [Ekhidna sp.]|uniref:iron-sulfur cluster repair di-iron protein n=1 Tax=Ekhidna sp. TaxID=2608089 RepID=UPI00351310D1
MKRLFLYMVFEKTIGQVVNENYVYARALHYLGVDFFEAPDKKLNEVCKERGLSKQRVIKSFYLFDSCHRFSFRELEKYPIELLTEYLKHTHHLFIKDKLPYIIHLVKKWDQQSGLKDLLPEFVEDFIKHIYEEEDTTFKYIALLSDIKNGHEKAPFSKLLEFENYSLEAEYEEHQDDDELGAIREIVANISSDCLHSQVLIHEIQAFDREMIYHAEIENNIFFPKALQLEEQVSKKLKVLSTLN